jgi:isochorismate synthase
VSSGLDVAKPRAGRVRAAQDLAGFVTDALARPAREGRLRALVLPVPAALSSAALLRALRGVDAWHLRSRAARLELLGLGTTARTAPVGDDRFAAVQRESARWLDELSVTYHPDAPRLPLRAFVGFAFAPGASGAEPWEPFGDALAVLPRWTLLQPESERGALVLAVAGRQPAELALAELHELLAAQRPAAAPTEPRLALEHEAKGRYEARVRDALAAIERGRLEKVVVSRRATVSGETDLDPVAVLDRLEGSAGPESTTYFVRRAGSVLLGVSPERLLAVRGTSLETEALAGTAREPSALCGSDKDRAEHGFVIDSIRGALAPFTVGLSVASSPEISPAGAVHHLRTRISASLRPGTHPLEVAAALHPTSAVAGTPRRPATDWIARHEPARGWYAGLVGTVDQHAGAELAVALRGGVIRGARAWAFSGGGIVRASEPAAEHEETALKMSGFLRALGVPT